MLNNRDKLEEGQIYYSVGVLQRKSCIEEWTYTRDRFDNLRNYTNNIFLSKDDAQKFLDYMREYNR